MAVAVVTVAACPLAAAGPTNRGSNHAFKVEWISAWQKALEAGLNERHHLGSLAVQLMKNKDG